MIDEIIALKAQIRELSRRVQELQYEKELQAATIDNLNFFISRLVPRQPEKVLRIVYKS